MNQATNPPMASYGSSPHHKPNRLYQQLLANNYLHDHIYDQSTPHAQPATIKFSTQLPLNKPPKLETLEKDQGNPLSPRKSGDSSIKTSHQVTQSLGSNYSIIEMENQSYSTVNLYSLSRNQIEPDLSLSSNQLTEQLNHDLPPPDQKSPNLLLEDSMRQGQILQEVSCLQLQDKLKKYRSEEFQSSQEQPVDQQEEKSPLPRLLADKYLKNDINKKFSSSHASDHEEVNFKTVLNQVYVVPYKINEEVQPYVFSLPVDSQRGSQIQEGKNKAISLSLNRSRQSEPNEEEEKEKNPLYFSSHINKHRPHPITTTHATPLLSEHRYERPLPKSQQKQYHYSNEKTARSNSIGCKSKPFLSTAKCDPEHPERLDHSRVTRIFKQEEKTQPKPPIIENSIIFDESEVSVCCTLGRTDKNANKITFTNKKTGFFCNEDKQEVGEVDCSKRIAGYKINPLAVIKGRQELKESDSKKKGLKLVGFHPSFLHKE